MFADEGDESRCLRVKICGITNPADAWAAIDAGADALGLNCYRKSRRYLEMDIAGEWIAALPDNISKVAVLVNPTWEEAVAVGRLPFITALQLHGSETGEFCARLAEAGIRFGKALPVTDENSLAAVSTFSTRTIVLDSQSAGFGGSGITFPWDLARRFVANEPAFRAILAGGLTPENVAEAIKAVRPFAVDVTSGVEASPGRKDHARLRAFIESARAA